MSRRPARRLPRALDVLRRRREHPRPRTSTPRSGRGLREIRMVDHVRASTTWVPEFLAAVARELPRPRGSTVRTGVEAKILDATGRARRPAEAWRSARRPDARPDRRPPVPRPRRPVEPARDPSSGSTPGSRSPTRSTCWSTADPGDAAHRPGQLAHPFSILPKIGLTESDLPDELLDALGRRRGADGHARRGQREVALPGPAGPSRLRWPPASRSSPSTDSHVATDVGALRLGPRRLRDADHGHLDVPDAVDRASSCCWSASAPSRSSPTLPVPAGARSTPSATTTARPRRTCRASPSSCRPGTRAPCIAASLDRLMSLEYPPDEPARLRRRRRQHRRHPRRGPRQGGAVRRPDRAPAPRAGRRRARRTRSTTASGRRSTTTGCRRC